MQVVPHALGEVGEEAIRGLGHLLGAGLLYDVRLDLRGSRSRRVEVPRAEPRAGGSREQQVLGSQGVGFKAARPTSVPRGRMAEEEAPPNGGLEGGGAPAASSGIR